VEFYRFDLVKNLPVQKNPFASIRLSLQSLSKFGGTPQLKALKRTL
jgi:hypothetical protein